MLKINAKAQNLCQNQASNFMPMLNQGSVNKEIDYPSKHFQNSCNWSKLKIIFFFNKKREYFCTNNPWGFSICGAGPCAFWGQGVPAIRGGSPLLNFVVNKLFCMLLQLLFCQSRGNNFFLPRLKMTL